MNIEIVEVATRDGFQSIGPQIDTQTKVSIASDLLDSGISRLELGAFVSPSAVPQMADTAELLNTMNERVAKSINSSRLSVLVATAKGGLRALQHGAKELVFVLSVSESHNQSNVRRSVSESLDELRRLVDEADKPFLLRLNLATSFDCPFEGRVELTDVCRLIERALPLVPDCEIGLCDTTGKALPGQVAAVCKEVVSQLSASPAQAAFHGHDTFGYGVANALFAIEAGIGVLDSSAAGLGGCPFAPGASGNTATEDLVFTLHESGFETGIDLQRLLEVADRAAELDGAATGGHVRDLPRERVLGTALAQSAHS